LKVGSYDPIINSNGEKLLALNLERIQHWLSQGIELEQRAAELLGIIQLTKRSHKEVNKQ